jgi:hypothetical protein
MNFSIGLISLLAMLQQAQASGSAPVDYTKNGANWGEEYPLCKYGKE